MKFVIQVTRHCVWMCLLFLLSFYALQQRVKCGTTAAVESSGKTASCARKQDLTWMASFLSIGRVEAAVPPNRTPDNVCTETCFIERWLGVSFRDMSRNDWYLLQRGGFITKTRFRFLLSFARQMSILKMPHCCIQRWPSSRRNNRASQMRTPKCEIPGTPGEKSFGKKLEKMNPAYYG